MAAYNYVVHFTVLRGDLGPGTQEKLVNIMYDDVDEDVPEEIVKDWAIREAHDLLKTRGHKHIHCTEINNA